MTPILLYLGLLLLLAGFTCGEAQNVTYCWGIGSNGQLGNGMVNRSDVPVQVLSNRSFATVCSGVLHSCALEPSGTAWCWGDSFYGRLGDGSDPLKQAISAIPVEVVGNHSFRSISCGWGHTCAVDDESRAWCWGFNTNGQLGSGRTNHSSVPMEVEGGNTFAGICAGRHHSCGVQDDGSALCWGSDTMLGAGLEGNISKPIRVLGNHTFASITCGTDHTCALEPPTNKAWCWGVRCSDGYSLGGRLLPITAPRAFCGLQGGSFGQLGNGDNETQLSPVPVSGNHAFATISAGWSHTCAITASGSFLCWGEPPGTGQGVARMYTYVPTVPPPVIGVERSIVAVSAASDATCVLELSGTVSCFDGPKNDTASLDPKSITLEALASEAYFISLGDAFFLHTCAVATKQANSPPLPPPLAPETPDAAFAPSPAEFPTLPAASAPTPAPSVGTSSSAAVPVGAIAAGAAAGAVVLAILAFFAWRPRKGWLRRQHAPPSPEDGKHGAAAPGGSAASSQGGLLKHGEEQGAAAPNDADAEVDTLLPYSVAVLDMLLPPSSASTSEAPAATPAAADAVASCASSGGSPAGDAVLSLISSYLGTRPEPTGSAQPPAVLATDGRSPSGGSSSAELRTDARLWEVQWEELAIMRRVGRGSFGSVYLAEWSHTRVAVKVLISKEDLERGQLELPEKVLHDLQAEAAVMRRMRHPNIVQFMGLVALPPALITEYCGRGSLYDCLAAASKQDAAAAQLTWRRRLAIAADAGTGLCYLHRRDIIHCDVKSPNLLVDEVWRVKVADFNLSKILVGARPESIGSDGGLTNPIWAAPEVLRGERATPASDVYSFGMVLYELLTWRLPWTFAVDMSPFKVGATIMAGGRPEVPPREALPGPDTASWSGLDAYVQLMQECWAQRPEERPSFDEVVGRLRQLLDAAPPSPA